MVCPTCDHTMQAACKTEDGNTLFWCPRCGTILLRVSGEDDWTERPKLVDRCRQFRKRIGPLTRGREGSAILQNWLIEGVAEGINVPSQRDVLDD